MKTAEPATVDHGNSQHAAQSAAIASDDAHPAKAAVEIGGADQGPVFRFDSGPTPSPLVAIVEVKEFNDPLDGHVPPSQEESLGFNAKLVLLSAFKDSPGTGSATELQWTSSSSARVREILSRTEDELRRQGIDCTTRADAGDPADVLEQSGGGV